MIKDKIKIKESIRLCISILLIYILIKLISWDEFIKISYDINTSILLLLFVLWFIIIFFKSIRWKILMQGYGIKESYYYTFILYWIGSFFNNFLPTSIGGDSYKYLALSKIWFDRKVEIGSSLVLERLVGLCTRIPFPILIGWLFLGQSQRFDLLYWGYSTGVSVIILIIAAGWFAARHFGNDMLTKAGSSIVRKVFSIIDVFFSYRDRTGLSLAILISIVLFVLSCLFYLLCFKAFGEQIGFMHLIFILPIISVAGAVPISINGLGVKEGLSVFLFSMFGISLEVAFAVALTARVLLIIATSTGGIAYLFVRPATVSGDHS